MISMRQARVCIAGDCLRGMVPSPVFIRNLMGWSISESPIRRSGSVVTVISWNANTEIDMDHYLVYRGTSSGVYTSSDRVVVGTTSLNVLGLVEGNRYWFVVTAVDTSGNESTQSNEVTKMIPKFGPAIFV